MPPLTTAALSRASDAPSILPPVATPSAARETAARQAAGGALAGDVEEVLRHALKLARESGRPGTEAEPTTPHLLTPEAIRTLPVQALRAGLDEIMLSKRADLGLRVLQLSGLLGEVLPEVEGLVGFGEGHNRHKDVWRHTLQVVIQSLPRLNIRWAALFHDIGKPRTRTIDERGTVHFLHHAEVGARMFSKLTKREGLFEADPELKENIRFLIYHHQRAHQYEDNWTDSATRRFALEVGDSLDDLMALSRADMTTKRKEKKRRYLQELKDLQVRVAALLAEDAKPKALPKGLGQALIDAFNLPPSKLVGDIRTALEGAVANGELPLQADYDVYLAFVRNNPDRFCLPASARTPR